MQHWIGGDLDAHSSPHTIPDLATQRPQTVALVVLQLYIALELADAGDLSRFIQRFREKKYLMPEKMIWKMFVQICAALSHMHKMRVMHRDIKPDNIFISVDGTVKLGDLGKQRLQYAPLETDGTKRASWYADARSSMTSTHVGLSRFFSSATVV